MKSIGEDMDLAESKREYGDWNDFSLNQIK